MHILPNCPTLHLVLHSHSPCPPSMEKRSTHGADATSWSPSALRPARARCDPLESLRRWRDVRRRPHPGAILAQPAGIDVGVAQARDSRRRNDSRAKPSQNRRCDTRATTVGANREDCSCSPSWFALRRRWALASSLPFLLGAVSFFLCPSLPSGRWCTVHEGGGIRWRAPVSRYTLARDAKPSRICLRLQDERVADVHAYGFAVFCPRRTRSPSQTRIDGVVVHGRDALRMGGSAPCDEVNWTGKRLPTF